MTRKKAYGCFRGIWTEYIMREVFPSYYRSQLMKAVEISSGIFRWSVDFMEIVISAICR